MPELPQKSKYYKYPKKNIVIGLVLILLTILFFPHTTYGQDEETPQRRPVLGTDASLGVAKIVEVPDLDIPDGSIVSTTGEGAQLSNILYDPNVIGVVSRDAAIIISSADVEQGLPVISTGQVYVLVSTQQGAIQKGDLITTSETPGIGVKALDSGYVIGTALEDYDNSDPEQTEKIVAELNLHYFNSKPTFPGNLTDIFKLAVLSTDSGPTPLFKYIVAALVVIGSFILGFMTFGRTAAKGVEALGRNPAAKGTIHLGIIFNVIIVIVIVLAGLTVAFLILRL